MGSSSASNEYIQVIDDVITKIREEFINNGGPGEGVLSELQGIWELKMMQAGAIIRPMDRSSSPANTVHDLNVPYEGPEEYETPTADLLFPPTPLESQTPLSAQTPLKGRMDNPLVDDNEAGRPSQYMEPPSSWLNRRPRLDVNVVFEEGHEEGDRGAAQQPTTQDFLRLASGKRKRDDFPSQYRPRGYIPQQDGAGDATADEFEIYNYRGVVNEDYNVANTPAPHELEVPTPGLVNQNDALDDDDEDDPLNENDDDDLDDGDDDKEDIHCQFDKVTRRAKNKWKCTLKDGIMIINNKHILFNKALGEFDF